MTVDRPVILEIIPHPRYRGDWLLKPTRGVPFGLCYGERAHAVSHAEWITREVDRAEIRVFKRDGTLAERRERRKGVNQGEQQ
jgi:hypothetical protein